MKKALKITGGLLAVLVVMGGLAFAGLAWLGERKLARTIDIRVVPVPFVKDAASEKLGRYLYDSRGCADCHGADGRGVAFLDDPNSLQVKAPNISSGPGSVVAGYSEADWVRAIRHGVGPTGRALQVMPSEAYNRLSDKDLAALVAYARALPPVAGEAAVIRLPLHVRALYGAGLVKDAAEKIDHRAPPAAPVAVGVNVEYGAYVANLCVGCHGAALTGSAMARYETAEAFVAMMRSGKHPDGASVSPVMPFPSLRNFNDTDLAALYAYLKMARTDADL